MHDLLWASSADLVSPAAQYSLFVEPLPHPPPSELNNHIAVSTIHDHPDLFKIVCNININVFTGLLINHPHQPFIQSVICSLCEGFWPWAEPTEDYPKTNDFPQHPPCTEEECSFLLSQRDIEIQADCFSQPFGSDLLPRMNTVPVHSVPKPHLDKLCLIVDHSASVYSINSMIDQEAIAGVKLDGIHTLGDSIGALHCSDPDASLILWKSDVATAYWQMPMHPLWQIKQVIHIDNQLCVDQCNNFGGCGSQKIWASFISLVLWIAIFKHHLLALKCYVDDHFSVGVAGDLELYPEYDTFLSSDQVKLLQLWDLIGLPHESHKQISGSFLPIIGFHVDPNAMMVCMPLENHDVLITACQAFTVNGACKSLQEFQRLQGWINWALNIYPFLCPALSQSYKKICGKTHPNALICVNNLMCEELNWFIHHIKQSNGIHMLKSVEWFPQDNQASMLVVFADASSLGMGIWFPGEYAGFQAALPSDGPKDLIFYYEALVVCFTIHFGIIYNAKHIAVYSNNTNSVNMFSSLCAKPIYNRILIMMSTINLILQHQLQFKVYYIPGVDNVIADHLSHFQNKAAILLVPKLVINSFQPPLDAMGAAKK